MSMLTEQEYEEYIRLLRVWMDAEKACLPVGRALARTEEGGEDAVAKAREAHAAVKAFRAEHGLGQAAVVTAAEGTATTYESSAEHA